MCAVLYQLLQLLKLWHELVGIYWGNGKENGNYYNMIGNILGLYWGNGKENGNPQTPPELGANPTAARAAAAPTASADLGHHAAALCLASGTYCRV